MFYYTINIYSNTNQI